MRGIDLQWTSEYIHVLMLKTTATRLKAKLGRYMRAVKEGQEVLVTDRARPVARLVPYAGPDRRASVETTHPRDPEAPPLGKVQVRSIRGRGIDTTAILRADRDR